MARRTRLMLHSLEARAAPSGGGDFYAADSSRIGIVGGDGVVGAPNAAPVISNFRAVVGPNGQVTFTGKVTDDQNPGGYTVRITGNGVDVTATVLRDGTFSVTTVATGPTDIMVSATTTDRGGLRSDPAYTTFTPSA